MSMDENIKEVLISQEQIHEKTKEVAQILSDEYRDKNPLVVGILKGALPFMADLIKEMDIFLEYDMMDVSSYGTAKTSSGEVKIVKRLRYFSGWSTYFNC
jgi:Hypoxanthine-guanine phosphoribosyltransferase